MESPPSSSSWSQAFILSDDSGLLLTNGSISSATSSFESRSSRKYFHFEDSDCEEKSLSQDDSLDGMSDIMCGENFNTLKKGPHWSEAKQSTSPIEPPPEFQDRPAAAAIEEFCERICSQILQQALGEFREEKTKKTRRNPRPPFLLRPYTPSDFAPFSPRRLQSSRLSSSHSSLSVPTARRVDDSTFITQAVSHDTLSDAYSAPFDSGDTYAVPVDVVRPRPKKTGGGAHRKRRRNTASGCREEMRCRGTRRGIARSEKTHWSIHQESKRHSVACTSAPIHSEPIHMTLMEVRQYLQTLYSSSSDSESKDKMYKQKGAILVTNNKYQVGHAAIKETARGSKKTTFMINLKNKKVKDSSENKHINLGAPVRKEEKRKKVPNKFFNFKQTLCNMFRFRRIFSPDVDKNDEKNENNDDARNNLSGRALPPLPPKNDATDEHILDFATSIQRVKDYGWYWGPISSEAAEKILSNEPDGSFIVRDSSDDHYIFSLTFKLNNCVRHVRIEHGQGNFSFGSCTKFKSQTIVEFIENAVEHSRSGRYLFFLHRRPVIGPVRVQLLHPVSRFKQVQSLQHMCRFVIHKNVRRDLIPNLPLPRRMIDYLNTPHYYSEHFVGDDSPRTSPTETHRENEEEEAPNNNDYVRVENGDDS